MKIHKRNNGRPERLRPEVREGGRAERVHQPPLARPPAAVGAAGALPLRPPACEPILCDKRNTMAERIGDYMIRTGTMNQTQVDMVIHAQKTGDKRSFGQIAVSLGFISQANVEAFLTVQK
jgi:hypothetical protein